MQLSDVTEGFIEKPFAEAAAASSQADANRIEPIRDYKEWLAVPLNDIQRHERALKLAELHGTIEAEETKLAEETARHKAEKGALTSRIDELHGEAKALARKVRDREDEALVQCREEKVFATGTIRSVRLDTGEQLDERPMSKSERQVALFPPDALSEERVDARDPDAPESFSDLHESDAPAPIMVEGEVLEIGLHDTIDFDLVLRNFGTRVHVQRGPDASDAVAGGDHVELIGHYGGEGGEEIATFIASEIRIVNPETEIDASKMATVGDVVEHKANGKGRRK